MIDEDELERRLRQARPVPAAGWRGAVRRELASRRSPPARPARLWLGVGASAGLGALLLALAGALAG
ncbi:MAG TPA: hypothetical protein VG165_12435 [Solirubrobacteraceae bacterium]|nr:hypothetical protein [Solirubrobacteraceae bacterium]